MNEANHEEHLDEKHGNLKIGYNTDSEDLEGIFILFKLRKMWFYKLFRS